MPQSKKIIWNSRHVILTGALDPLSFKHSLLSEHLDFEIHDRDKRIEKGEFGPQPFGVASICI
jgi:hypothetical protein